MALLMNWPPSRGVNPHVHKYDVTPSVSIKDLPAPKQHRTAIAEKDLISEIQSPTFKLPRVKIRPRSMSVPRKQPLLAGTWKVWFQVEDVANLTLQQADAIIRACKETGEGRSLDHFDNWCMFAPRPLWVDLTYPLTRGVRLCVKPVVWKAKPCKACGDKHSWSLHRPTMSPGYFLWVVAQEYVRIYREHKKYGVWGHALSDLGFERITIRKDGVVDLYIGS